MSQKEIIALFLLLSASCGGILLTTISKRARDLFFFLLVTLSAVTERLDVNFVSRDWYRGTTCGFEVSLVDVFAISLLISSFLVPRQGTRRWFWPASLGFMLFYFCFTGFCVAISDPKLFGLFALSKLLRGLVVFLAAALYVQRERELRVFILSLGTIVCLEALRGIEQRYRFGIHRVFADLDAPNSLSMYLCMTTPIFVAALASNLPRLLKILSGTAIALASLGVILTISRAGVVVLILVLLGATAATISFKLTARKVFVASLIAVAAMGVLAKSWKSLGSRFGEASLEQEYENKHAQGRGYYIRMAAAILDENWFGVGPNNWSYWVSNKYGPRMGFKFAPYPGTDKPPKFVVAYGANVDDPQAAPAHSLAALTAGEMGFGGLSLLIVLWLRWFQISGSFLRKRTTDPMRRMGVGIFFGTLGLFLQSLTEWVFHQTAIFFTFNIMLGIADSLYYLKRQEHRKARAEAAIEEENWGQLESAPTGSY
ncbi:MAG: O-antigen ligase family protein [Verrucomicrobiota bacterium]